VGIIIFLGLKLKVFIQQVSTVSPNSSQQLNEAACLLAVMKPQQRRILQKLNRYQLN